MATWVAGSGKPSKDKFASYKVYKSQLDNIPDYSEGMTVASICLEIARYCHKTELPDKTRTLDIPRNAGITHSCNGLEILSALADKASAPWQKRATSWNRQSYSRAA